MSSRKILYVGGVLLASGAVAYAEPATPPADPGLSDKVDALRAIVERQQAEIEAQKSRLSSQAAEIDRLRGAQNDAWLNQRRSEEIKALVREVLADADTRASLAETALTAGHNGQNFFIASEDGNFLLRIEGLLQARYIYNHRQGNPQGTMPANPGVDRGKTDTSGFELGRAKLEFSGHVFTPRLRYFLRIGVNREDTEVTGERTVIGYQLTDPGSSLGALALWGGEDQGPFLRESMISPGRQLAVDRSLFNSVFTQGIIQGMWLTWDPDPQWHFVASINDGFRSGEPDNEYGNATITVPPDGPPELPPFSQPRPAPSTKPFFLDRADIAFTGRADLKVFKDSRWDQWEDFSAWQGDPEALFVGAAVNLEVSETGSTRPNDKQLMWTADVSYKRQGLALFGAVAGWHGSLERRSDRDYYGAMGQVGYMLIPDKLEPFARFEWIDMDGNIPAGDRNDLYLVTAGVNYYLRKHHAKFTIDVVWALHPIPSSRYLGTQDNDGYQQGLGFLGLREDQVGQDNQVAIRAQMQLLF